ncbi:hypothetical protein ElyMa_004770400 [Elysia marginata]|uniref:Uncharacterized protein n=1 Tax=Elysia marginata TaxID=1093978 RepID=A0AAV4IKI2_9GAST|nr:hypothetical protein ElyMa_004770400 [Elysia marginata]
MLRLFIHVSEAYSKTDRKLNVCNFNFVSSFILFNSARYRSEARRPWGRRTVMRWGSNPPCKNKSATETPTNTLSQQVLDGTPATRADMPSMKVKGQTRKEAFDPTRSMTSPRHQVR